MKRFALVLAMLAGSVFIAASPASTNTLPDDTAETSESSSSDDGAKSAESSPPDDAVESSPPVDTADAAESSPPVDAPKKAASAQQRAASTKPVDDSPPDDTDHKIDICHLPPGNPANGQSISVDFDSIINGTGHGNDGLDIIPPFSYTKQGVPGSFPGQNWDGEGQAQYANECDADQPNQPDAMVENKDETGDPNCTDKTVTTTFYVRTTPYEFDETSWTWVLGTPGEWVVNDTTSRAATVEECPLVVDNTDHKIDICHLPPGNPANGQSIEVDYDSIINGTGHGNDGLDIIPPFDYIKQGVPGSFPGQNWTAEGQAQYENDCNAEAVVLIVVPVAPVAADDCGEDGSISLPVTEGVTYAFTVGDGVTGAWTVTATAQEGFAFADNTVAEWSGTVTVPEECAGGTQIVVAEVVVDEICPGTELPTPTEVEGVVYTFTVGDGVEGPWEITATAEDGYELLGQSVFTGDAGEGECVDGVSLEDEDDALLPDTGGVPLGLLLIGGMLTLAGVAVLGRQRILN